MTKLRAKMFAKLFICGFIQFGTYVGFCFSFNSRSPSPEPIYSTDGKRLNTRENRTRKKLEDDRHKLIQRLQELNPDYRPPQDYRYFCCALKITDNGFIVDALHCYN